METVWSYKQVGNVCIPPEARVSEGMPLRLGWGPGRGGLARALPPASWMNTLPVAPPADLLSQRGFPEPSSCNPACH